MKLQITAAATKLMARGRKIDRLGHRLVADAVDQHGDEQAEPDHERGRRTTQMQLLRSASSVSRLVEEPT